MLIKNIKFVNAHIDKLHIYCYIDLANFLAYSLINKLTKTLPML
jgi:hypothetical protein